MTSERLMSLTSSVLVEVLVGMTKWGIDYTFDCIWTAACRETEQYWVEQGSA